MKRRVQDLAALLFVNNPDASVIQNVRALLRLDVTECDEIRAVIEEYWRLQESEKMSACHSNSIGPVVNSY